MVKQHSCYPNYCASLWRVLWQYSDIKDPNAKLANSLLENLLLILKSLFPFAKLTSLLLVTSRLILKPLITFTENSSNNS